MGRPFCISCVRSLLVFLLACTISTGLLSSPVEIPFSVMLLQSQLPHEGSRLTSGQNCIFHHSSHECIVLSNILPSAENLLFFSKTSFLDLSWTLKDIPCFSEIRFFCYLAVGFVKARFYRLALSTYQVLL